MHIENPARKHAPEAAVGSSELAEGLMLVRASTLKMIRLQLAMERQDRRVALEAVDELVALDRRLQDYLADVPAAPEQLLFRNELDADRAMLNREKLILGAEVIRRPPTPETETAAETDDDDWLGPHELPEAEEEPRRSRWRLAAVPILASAIAGGAYALGWPEIQAWLAAAIGGLL